MQVYDSINEVVADVFQEILLLIAFGASFYLWKSLSRHAKRRGYCLGSRQVLVKHQKGASLGECSPPKLIKTNPEARPAKQTDRLKVDAAQEKILRLLELREFTSALNAYRAFEREGLDRFFASEAMFSSFIQSAVRVGKLDVVERMLRAMLRNQVTPSIEFWHSTLKMLSSRKHYATCLEIYVEHGSILPNDKVIFSCLINAALESGVPQEAVPMLNRYEESDLEPSDYVTAFRIHVAVGDVDKAVELCRDLKASMTPLMLNLVLLACVNAKQPERAMDLLLEAQTYERQVTNSRPSQRDPTKCSISDAISYNTVIKGFVASGNVAGCVKCLRSMQARSLKPDDVTLTSLLEISFTDKRHALTDTLVELLMEIGEERTVDVGTCNIFIKGLLRADRLRKAIQVYECLKACPGSQPNIVTYSIMIKALVDARNLQRALLVVEDMVSQGVPPDEIIFTHLVEGCRVAGNHALGERIFDDMIAAGVKPSEYTLTMMVKLRGRYGAHEQAHELVANWEATYGTKPSVIHYTCLMSGCLRAKQYDQAWAAYELLEQHGVLPDEHLLSTLLPGMVVSGHNSRVLTLARRALRRPGGSAVPVEALRNALAQLSSMPDAKEEAEELESLMQAAGLSKPDASREAVRRAPWRREARTV